MLDRYLQWLEHNRGSAVSTVNNYSAWLKRLAVHCADRGSTLETADRRILEEFTGPVLHKTGISLRGRRPVIAAVRGLYKWAESEGIVAENSAKHISYPRVGKALPRAISMHNAEKMLLRCNLEDFAGVRDAALIAMLIGSGMRVSGLASMTSGSLIVRQDTETGRGMILVRVTEKGRKERIIPLPDIITTYLLQYTTHPEMQALAPVLGLADGENVLWVQTNRGTCAEHEWYGEKRRLSVSGIRRIIKRRGQEAGIPAEELHPHAFRHLYGTELAEHDTDPKRIQLLMGHSSLESSSIYIHLAERKLREAVEAANPLKRINTPTRALHEKMTRARDRKLLT